jgi:lysophospholipase L1-like esterase
MIALSKRSRLVLLAGALAGAWLAALPATGTNLALALAGASQARAATQHKKSARRVTYYVSVGDSYSVGYQPVLGATSGYTGYVAKKTHLKLVNFGCGGATTTSLLTAVGCPDNLPHTAGAVLHPTTTQAAAAEAFLTAHRGQVGLITISIGGNDVTSCAAQADPITCVGTAVAGITQNVTSLATALRAAAGPKVPLIGLTYPDVILGDDVYPSLPATPARMALAQESIVAFKSLINPALAKAYAAGQGVLVDVTAASGAYTPLTRTIALKPYGQLPVPVARVCSLTWFCNQGNIHATTKGYTFIGQLIVARYASLRGS